MSKKFIAKPKWLANYIVSYPDGTERNVQRVLEKLDLDKLINAIAFSADGAQYRVLEMKKIK